MRLCAAAPRGRQHTYALVDERAPLASSLDRDEALAELTRRYFTSRGPATLKDYRWWSSLTAAEGRRGLEMVSSELEHEVVDGRTYWFASPSRAPRRRSPVIDLVQGYDESVVSYSESKDVLRPLVVAGGKPSDVVVFMHAVLLDGQVIGHWRPVSSKGSVVIETSLYRRLDRVEALALEAAVGRYGRFLGPPATALVHGSHRLARCKAN